MLTLLIQLKCMWLQGTVSRMWLQGTVSLMWLQGTVSRMWLQRHNTHNYNMIAKYSHNRIIYNMAHLALMERIWAGKAYACRYACDDNALREALTMGLADGIAELDTQLGKLEENGIDLSGGQWQRVAVARACLPDSAFVILDEPAASLRTIPHDYADARTAPTTSAAPAALSTAAHAFIVAMLVAISSTSSIRAPGKTISADPPMRNADLTFS